MIVGVFIIGLGLGFMAGGLLVHAAWLSKRV